MFRMQQQYIIFDDELKEQIISELKLVLNPCYEAFIGRVNQSSLCNEGLIKYPQKIMEGMLDKMFTGKPTESSKGGKKAILSKLK